MYANKQQYYKSVESKDYNRSSSLTKKLVRELDLGEFCVCLQPKIDLYNDKLYGAEALARRIDTKGTIISPDKFIHLYESNGTIRHIDFFVLETVCKYISDLKIQGKQINDISVNFSKITLLEYDVVSNMRDMCKKYNVSPSNITIEMTASISTLQPEELNDLVYKIKKAGFNISLDDYGNDFSNIGVLSDVDFDKIKLDKNIVTKLTSNTNVRTITKYIIKILKNLNITHILAEGIETEEQLEIVKKYGCKYAQGNYFSEPITIEKFTETYLNN